MRKLVYSFIVSLDGYIAAPDGTFNIARIDEELHRFVNRRSREVDTAIYGRRMYEIMKFWQTADADPKLEDHMVEFAKIWQRMDKLVFSRTLNDVGPRTKLVREVNPDEIRALKALSGKNISVSGAELAAEFIRLGLVDEYELYVAPVMLGGGKPMFQAGTHADLQLIETSSLSSGVIHQHYRTK